MINFEDKKIFIEDAHNDYNNIKLPHHLKDITFQRNKGGFFKVNASEFILNDSKTVMLRIGSFAKLPSYAKYSISILQVNEADKIPICVYTTDLQYLADQHSHFTVNNETILYFLVYSCAENGKFREFSSERADKTNNILTIHISRI